MNDRRRGRVCNVLPLLGCLASALPDKAMVGSVDDPPPMHYGPATGI